MEIPPDLVDGSLWSIQGKTECEVGQVLPFRTIHPSVYDLFGVSVIYLRVLGQLWLMYQIKLLTLEVAFL